MQDGKIYSESNTGWIYFSGTSPHSTNKDRSVKIQLNRNFTLEFPIYSLSLLSSLVPHVSCAKGWRNKGGEGRTSRIVPRALHNYKDDKEFHNGYHSRKLSWPLLWAMYLVQSAMATCLKKKSSINFLTSLFQKWGFFKNDFMNYFRTKGGRFPVIKQRGDLMQSFI